MQTYTYMHAKSGMRNTVSFFLAICLAVLILPGSFVASVPTTLEKEIMKVNNFPTRHVKKPPVTLSTVKENGHGLPHLPVTDFQEQALDPAVSQTSAGDDAQKALEDSAKKLSQLYKTIRNVALPQSDITSCAQRLVMLIPGKVLSYYDYYPGKSYEASMDNPDQIGKQVNIPVRVMENMFALADAVPGIDPLRGAETGESMALIYENILNWMQIKGFNAKTQQEKKHYLVAVDYLTQIVPDPLNVSVNVTKFNLYRRSQEAYNAKRLEMEDIIAKNRSILPAPEFESWFQRNYPTLNARVEAAYTEWLIFGEKEIVELYKSYLDVQAPGLDLENARMALRASGVVSLDRSRTVYPVSFVPSNWYRYLTDVDKVDKANKYSALSGDQIRFQIGQLRAKKIMLEVLKTAPIEKEASNTLADTKVTQDKATKNLQDTAKATEANRQKCLSKRGCSMSSSDTTVSVTCDELTKSSGAVMENIALNSNIHACADGIRFQLNTTLQKAYYDQAIKDIDASINEYQKALSTSQVPLSQLAQHAADSKEQLDSQWMQFEFDSSKSSQQTDTSSSYSSYSVSANVGFAGMFSASASYSTSKAEQEFSTQMNRAKIAISGQLLRVTIQRPWFRPSIFRSAQFEMADKLLVSPGDELSEQDFVKAALERSKYLLPHYASGFLLSRNVSLEYRELSSSAVYHAIQRSSSFSAGFSVNYGLWRGGASSSGSWGSDQSHARTEATENGLRVTIPGVQIIGYYTQNVPLFPKP